MLSPGIITAYGPQNTPARYGAAGNQSEETGGFMQNRELDWEFGACRRLPLQQLWKPLWG
jgi:hypothetical protein